MIKCPVCEIILDSLNRYVCDMSEGHPAFYHIECYNKKFNREFKTSQPEPIGEDRCELCDASGDLFAKDDKDKLGRPIVLMVCAKCSKKKAKS